MSFEAFIAAGQSYTRCDNAQDVFKTSEASPEETTKRRKTIVIPTVCVGNVAQLAIDLLLSSAQQHAAHIAMLRHPLVLPCFGVNPYASRADQTEEKDLKGITSHAAHPMDLYKINRAGNGTDSEVYVVQQRAPASAGCQAVFSSDLMAWVREAGFDEVWILGSLSAEYRKDRDLVAADDIKFLCGGGSAGASMSKQCVEAGLAALSDEYREIHESETAHMPWALLKAAGVTDGWDPAEVPETTGNAAGEEGGLRAAAVLKFALEGDNRMDASIMAKAVGQLFGMDMDLTRVPTSWLH